MKLEKLKGKEFPVFPDERFAYYKEDIDSAVRLLKKELCNMIVDGNKLKLTKTFWKIDDVFNIKKVTYKELKAMSHEEFMEYLAECRKDPEFMKEIDEFIKEHTE